MKRLGFELYVLPLPVATREAAVGSDDTLIHDDTNWVRVPMYQRMESVLSKELGAGYFEGKNGIEIGGSEGTLVGMLRKLGARVEIAPEYPSVDVERLPYRDGSYDLVILDQVLEHVRRPWKAVEEIKRVLKPGGVSVCTSVFIYPIHKGFSLEFGDYYRYSTDGLRSLFEGFEIITANGWGNARVLRLAYDQSERGPEGPPPLPKERLRASGLYDYVDGMNHIVTWCIARKPARH